MEGDWLGKKVLSRSEREGSARAAEFGRGRKERVARVKENGRAVLPKGPTQADIGSCSFAGHSVHLPPRRIGGLRVRLPLACERTPALVSHPLSGIPT